MKLPPNISKSLPPAIKIILEQYIPKHTRYKSILAPPTSKQYNINITYKKAKITITIYYNDPTKIKINLHTIHCADPDIKNKIQTLFEQAKSFTTTYNEYTKPFTRFRTKPNKKKHNIYGHFTYWIH